jgi:predicted transcriptional regulator
MGVKMIGGEAELEHRTRKQVFNYIQSYPGVSFGSIQRFFDVNESTLKYHLNYLERSNKIYSKREGKRRCYFCENHSGEHPENQNGVDLNVLNKNQKMILNLVHKHPGVTKKELLTKTKLNRNTLSYNLQVLVDRHVIWQVGEFEMGYEYITPEKLQQEMYNRLLMRLLKDEIDEDTFLKIKKKLEKIDPEELK